MIRALNLCLSLGNEIIYDDASFYIENGSKVGVVGVNGAGKTTLFRLLLKEIELDSGALIIHEKHLGYLPQEIKLKEQDISVYDYLLTARPTTILRNELNQLYKDLNKENETLYLKRINKIEDELNYYNEYNVEDDLLELLASLNIDLNILERKLNTLSGGEKSKMAFVHLLFSKPEILLLDEPTNHLDKKSKEYIINYLKKYHGTLLVISHDIDFLNATIEHTLFINKATHKCKLYHGDYHYFKRHYAEEMALKEMRILNQEREIKKLQDFIKRADEASRTNHHLKTMGQAKQKLLDKKLEKLEVRDKNYKHVKMKIEPLTSAGKVPLEVRSLSFHYQDKEDLYQDLSFSLTPNEHFLIVGENGIGKSTLLKLIMHKLEPITGEIIFSKKTTVSYYAQELEILNLDKSVLENVDNGNYLNKEVRSYLSNFLFFNDDVFKKVNVLSPGEKARLALCKILLEKHNLLLLDEPTNHLDVDTQAIIGENFKDFNGTLLVVSHNPKFVESLGITRMLILPEGKIVNYEPSLLRYYYYLNTDF